jgi:hypothetical protein
VSVANEVNDNQAKKEVEANICQNLSHLKMCSEEAKHSIVSSFQQYNYSVVLNSSSSMPKRIKRIRKNLYSLNLAG